MIISKTGHSVNPESVNQMSVWDTTKKIDGISYAGSLDYNLNGNRYLNPITASEIDQLKRDGVTSVFVPTKYSGTY